MNDIKGLVLDLEEVDDAGNNPRIYPNFEGIVLGCDINPFRKPIHSNYTFPQKLFSVEHPLKMKFGDRIPMISLSRFRGLLTHLGMLILHL